MHSKTFHWLLIVAIMLAALPVMASQAGTAAAQATCGTAPAPRLSIGQTARVVVSSGTGNNLRSGPSATGTTVLGVMPEGEIFTVIAGPQCAENFWWYEVRRWDGQTGWTSEGVSGDYWVQPWPFPGATIPTGTAPDLPNAEIAYFRGDALAMTAYAMGADGTNARMLGGQVAADNVLAWSSTGRVAYSDGSNIWVVGETDVINLTNTTGASNYQPAWSPDGTQIAFVSNRDGNAEIYVVAVSGGALRRLTNDPAEDLMPAWSPDGTRLAFVSTRTGSMALFMLGVAGTPAEAVTADAAIDVMSPAWSPDGTQIAYIGAGEDQAALYTIQPGGIPLTLTTTESVLHFAWAPDGSRIAYAAEVPAGSGAQEVFSVRPDGTDRLQYTVDGGTVAGVSWSPDGNWIAFAKGVAGARDIFTLRAAGFGLANLTNSPTVDETHPTFQPASTPGILQPPTPVPGTTPAAPTNPAAQDLLLIYDAAVPVFTLKNVSGQYIDLTPLSFSGAGMTVSTAIWADYSSSPINAFMPNACLMVWRFGLPEQPTPAECGTARQGWTSDQVSMFWTGPEFTVLYNGAPVATCQSAAGRCDVDLP